MRRDRMRDSQVLAPGLKQASTAVRVRSRSASGGAAGIDGGERVDQHDLPVEPGEVVAEERLHDVRLVALETARQQSAEAAAPMAAGRGRRQREEGQQRRAGEVAGEQEAPRTGRGERGIGRPRLLQVAREEARRRRARPARPRGRRHRRRRETRAMPWRSPGDGVPRASPIACRDHCREIEVEQWQVEQPLARIVDDVDVEPAGRESAAQPPGGRVLDGDAQLAQAPRALRPARRRAGQLGQVLLVGEARHAVVGLRLQIGARDAALGHGREERQPAAHQEVADERRDEHGLARAGEPGDAEAHGRRHQVGEARARLSERARRAVADVPKPHGPLPFLQP